MCLDVQRILSKFKHPVIVRALITLLREEYDIEPHEVMACLELLNVKKGKIGRLEVVIPN